MAFPLLLPAAKGLIGGAIKVGAKKALMNKAKSVVKNKAKDFIKGKKESIKEKGGALVKRGSEGLKKKGGALVKSLQGGGVSAITNITKAPAIKPKDPEIESTGGKLGFEKINTQVSNLVSISSSIDGALKGQYKAELKERKERKKLLVAARRSRRERLLEGVKGAGGILSGIIGGVAGKFNFFDFIKNILIGGILLFLLKNFKKIMAAFNFLRENLYLTFLLLRGAFQLFGKGIGKIGLLLKGALKGTLKLIVGGIKGILKPIGAILKSGVKNLGKMLRSVGSAIFNFGKNIFTNIVNFAKNSKILKNVVKYANQLGKLLKRGGKAAFNAIKSLTKPIGKGLSIARKGLATAGGALKKGGTFLTKVFGKGTSSSLKGIGSVMKNVAKVAQGIKIPIVGPIIVAVSSLLSGDPPTKTLFKAVGAGLGEALGTLIPIPVLGTIIGGLLGELGGELFYDLIKGGGVEAVKKKLFQKFQGALKIGGKVVDWFKGGFERLVEGLPKNPFKLGGFLLNPFNFLEKFELLKNAFFPPNDNTVIPEKLSGGEDFTQGEDDSVRPETAMIPGGPVNVQPTNLSGDKKEAFDTIYNSAKKYGAKYPELTAAQAMFESAYLTSDLATMDNNPFGQTGKGSAGSIKVKDKTWARYTTLDDAVKQHVEYWDKDYKGEKGFNSYSSPIDGLRAILPTYAPESDDNNHANYIKGVGGIMKAMGYDINKGTTTRSAPVVQATTPMVGSVTSQEETGDSHGHRQGGGGPQVQVQTTGTGAGSGSGLRNIVPTANLMATGVGTGDVGMTSGRGMRWGRMHRGVDIGTSGEKGYYVAFKLKGKVSDVGTFAGYGKTVVITSGGKDFLFAHLAQTMVKKGQAYNGEIIGEIGNTGAGTGEHLHFEVSPAGTGGYQQDEDPMPYVKYLVIGRMGDGSAVGTTTVDGAQVIPGGDSHGHRQGGGSVASTGPMTRDIEQYPTYDDPSSRNIVIMGQGGNRGEPVPAMRSGRGNMMRRGASTTDMLNSYYKQQLLGLLYKVG